MNFDRRLPFLTFIACFLLLVSYSNAQQKWVAFQNGGSVQNENWKLPTEWQLDNGIQWSTQLAGYGQSTPLVFKETVYLTAIKGANKERLIVEALSAKTGEQLWAFDHSNSAPEKNTPMVSRAAPTPIVDDQGIIAFFEGGNLFALNHSGEVRWKRDLKAEFGELKARHGLAASLEQDDKHVFVWCERMESPFVLAINKTDGKSVWKVPGVGGTSWSSPRIMSIGDEQHLVLSASGAIVGLHTETGERRWEFKEVAGNSSTTPVDLGEGRMLIGSSGGREGAASIPSCGVLEVNQTDEAYTVDWVWTAKKASCSFGSPIAFDGKAYFVNRSGVVSCHDLKSGKQIFAGRLPCGQIWATPLATKDVIYFFGKDGNTAVVKTGDQLDVLAENQLWELQPSSTPQDQSQGQFSGPVLYAAAVMDSGLLLRRGDILYCVGN